MASASVSLGESGLAADRRRLTLGGIVSGESCEGWCSAAAGVSKTSPGAEGEVRAAYEAFKLPRRLIEPREANCEPARDRKVVVAGIVTGCRWVV